MYQYELPTETSSDARSADINDSPTIPAVPFMPTLLPQLSPSPSPPPPPTPQVATLYLPRFYKIPQDLYHAKRWNFTQLEPILFQADEFPGVNMGEALSQNFASLQGRDDPVLQEVQTPISLRLWVRLPCRPHSHSAKELTNLSSFLATRSAGPG